MGELLKENTFFKRLYKASRRVLNFGAFLGLFYLAFDPSFSNQIWYLYLQALSISPIYFVYLMYLILGLIVSETIFKFLSVHIIDIVFFAPLLTMTFGGAHPAHILLVRQLTHYFFRIYQQESFPNLAQSISKSPARLMAISFLGISLIGAFLLVLPVSVAPGHNPSFLNAIFTSTSAVCVTGLIVVDTGTYFSFFGQAIILMLIQIGGLGIMTLSAGVSLFIGKKMAMSQSSVMKDVLDQSDIKSLKETLNGIFKWTFIIELIGAIILTIRFYVLKQCSLDQAFYLGIFHSISAFCNAGFSIFNDSFMRVATDPVINITIMCLIITGGLGFTVFGALNAFLAGYGKKRVCSHVSMVLKTTLFLIIAGTLVIFILEFNSPSTQGMSLYGKFITSLFQSVSTRTAGFNTVDFSLLKTSTLFFMAFLMFIGASPGSTGGGIKTTTFATILLFLDSKMRGKNEVTFRGRSIPSEVVLKAFLITAISAGIIFVYTFLLILLENKPLIKIIFEVFSAFATVGLSTGITGDLCDLSKLLIISLMFIGRIGPLTLALSIHTQGSKANLRYPETRILVG